LVFVGYDLGDTQAPARTKGAVSLKAEGWDDGGNKVERPPPGRSR
jgi:hypothetical protein